MLGTELRSGFFLRFHRGEGKARVDFKSDSSGPHLENIGMWNLFFLNWIISIRCQDLLIWRPGTDTRTARLSPNLDSRVSSGAKSCSLSREDPSLSSLNGREEERPWKQGWPSLSCLLLNLVNGVLQTRVLPLFIVNSFKI